MTVQVIPTGWSNLDAALGIGGIPRGRITEISGPAESGKTGLALKILAQATRLRLFCAWIDADHAFDLNRAQQYGTYLDRVLYSDPSDAEMAVDTLAMLSRSTDLGLIVLDSADHLIPLAEMRQELGKADFVPSDPLLSQALPSIKNALHRSNVALLVTRLADSSLSGVYRGLSTNPARLTLALHASIRLRLRPLSAQRRIEVRIIKNDFTGTYANLELDFFNNDGMINTS